MRSRIALHQHARKIFYNIICFISRTNNNRNRPLLVMTLRFRPVKSKTAEKAQIIKNLYKRDKTKNTENDFPPMLQYHNSAKVAFEKHGILQLNIMWKI